MKALFITILIFGTAFAAYDYFFAAPWERLIFERSPKPASPSTAGAVPSLVPHEVHDDGPQASRKPKSADDYTPTIPKIPSREFEPPAIASIEALTRNWTTLPAHAFPRPVVLRTPVAVRMAAGASTLPAGATVFALSCDNGNLTVAPTETSAARGAVALTQTDIQDQLRVSYETWKAGRIDAARQAWLAKKTAVGPSKAMVAEPVSLAGSLDERGKPLQGADGSYPLLLASMQSGQVTEITKPKVKSWGKAEEKVIDGEPTWTVDVWYDTVVFCGPITAQAQAHVRGGRVMAWIYPSGEPVP